MTPEQRLAEARNRVDEKYRSYIILQRGNPYMMVHGRVSMMVDEHREKEGTWAVRTEFVPIGQKTLLCRATVTSALRGSAMGHAQVMFGGKGADATNPLENSETSAIGRALVFLGYGPEFGIASAEEVDQTQQTQPLKEHPITKKQEEALHEIAAKLNPDDAAVIAWLAQTGKTSFDELTSVQAESLIAAGQQRLRSEGKMEGPTREEIKDLFTFAGKKGVKHDDVHAYMKKAAIALDSEGNPSTKRLKRIEYQQVMQAIENGAIRPPVGTSTVIAEVGENGEKIVNGDVVNTSTGEIKDEAKEKAKMPY